MSATRAVTTGLAAALFALGLAGAAHSVGASAAARPAVKLAHTGLGRVLVDHSGRTLYMFAADTHGRPTCAGACAGVWRPYTAKGHLRAGKGLSARRLELVRRPGGGLQVSYAGHPLYRYAGDTRRGQTSGENVLGFGARWYAVSARGKRVPPKPAAPSPPPSPGPYTY